MGQLLGIRFGVNSEERYNDKDRRIEGGHEAVYAVQMNTESARENDVVLVAGVPAIGQESTVYPGAYCVSRQVRETAPLYWDVTCAFETISPSKASEAATPPQDRTPRVSWGAEIIEEPLFVDAQDGSAIRNSALEPLPGASRPIAIPVLTVERYETVFEPSRILDFLNHVNDASFYGAAAGQALIAGITANPVEFEGQDIWQTTYVVKFNMQTHGWKAKLLDQGTYYWSGTVGTSQKVPFGDSAFQQLVGNLNGSGGENTTTTPQFVEYNRFDEADFSTLNLGPF